MKTLFLLENSWFDGTGYKLPEYLKSEFNIEYTRGDFNGDVDLGICRGSKHKTYKKFLEKGIPYILIEHDIESMRLGMNDQLYCHEKEKIENASKVIFTSEDHAEYYEHLKEMYGWKLPEYVVIHNKPLLRDIQFESLPKLKGLNLVYAGSALARWGRGKMYGHLNHKAYHHIFEEFIKNGWNVHFYPTKASDGRDYKELINLGVIIHRWVSGDKIYKEMSQYTAGLNAFNDINTPEIALKYAQHTRPNKTYDYLAAGIPTIGYQAGECMEIYKDKWGIVINDLSEIKDIPERLKEINIKQEWRVENTLDKEKGKFEYILNVKPKAKKIVYYTSRHGVGSAYKTMKLLQNNYGGAIIRDKASEFMKELKDGIDFIVVRGDSRKDYRLALKYKLPYVLVANDISSLRKGYSEHEKEMVENASYVVFSSEEHLEYCQKYNLPEHTVIYNRPLKDDLDFKPLEKLEGLNLVYAGGLGKDWMRSNETFGYRAYHEIFKQFIESGWKVHLYPTIYGVYSSYKGLGCIVHKHLPYQELIKEMSQYTAGFHGYNKENVPELSYNYALSCRANKIWDYLAAGIPTIGFQGGKGMNIYRNKWGIVLRSLSDQTIKNIPKRLEKIKITNQMRYKNTMDEDLDKYQVIVEKLSGLIKDKKPAPIIETSKWEGGYITIQVENKRPYQIERGNLILEPYEKTNPVTVSKSQWKEIKSHVGLRILYF